MAGIVNLEEMTWLCKPRLYLLDKDRIVIETEPFTDLRPAGMSAEAVELKLPARGSFCFRVKTQFVYRNVFDQCGLILYEGDRRKAIIFTQRRDDETTRLQCIVFHQERGDISVRDIGSAIDTMLYRIWYRSGAVRIQYSFNTEKFSDLREFWLDLEDDKEPGIGIFACSPANSSFDCTFSEMVLEEE